MSALEIEIWSDVVCPWCYLGRARLRRALAEVGGEAATVTWRSLQLNPEAPRFGEPGAGAPLAEYLGEKFGPRVGAMQERLRGLMEEEGLPYAPERGHFVNSYEAHRLIKRAERADAAEAVVGRLFELHHAEGGRIDDPAALAALAAEAGLDPAAEAGEEETAAVAAEIGQAARLGIGGVPFFVFAGRLAVSGARETAVLVEAITRSQYAAVDG